MAYKAINNVTVLLVDDTIIAGDSDAINTALPTMLPGTIIHDAGYQTVKQKGLDGSWVTV